MVLPTLLGRALGAIGGSASMAASQTTRGVTGRASAHVASTRACEWRGEPVRRTFASSSRADNESESESSNGSTPRAGADTAGSSSAASSRASSSSSSTSSSAADDAEGARTSAVDRRNPWAEVHRSIMSHVSNPLTFGTGQHDDFSDARRSRYGGGSGGGSGLGAGAGAIGTGAQGAGREDAFERFWQQRHTFGTAGAGRPGAASRSASGPSAGRTVLLDGRQVDVNRAMSVLNQVIRRNNIRSELRLGERYEKPNQKRRRLRSERHRRRFANMVREKVKLIMDLKHKGA